MFYKEWKFLYERIAQDFYFQEKYEIKTANILNNLLKQKKMNLLSEKKLELLISNKEVVVFGAGPSLESSMFLELFAKKNIVEFICRNDC